MSTQIPQLLYRGNFQCEVGIDYSGALFTDDYGGGLLESVRIFPGLHTARLGYTALHRRVTVRLQNGETASRLNYIWWFYRNSKDNANRPFLMRNPLDEQLYLWFFPDDGLSITLVDLYLGTAGLQLKQVSVRGVEAGADGSIDEDSLPIVLP